MAGDGIWYARSQLVKLELVLERRKKIASLTFWHVVCQKLSR
jgi:hypothetical protein